MRQLQQQHQRIASVQKPLGFSRCLVSQGSWLRTWPRQQLGASVHARRAVRDLDALTAGLPISEVIHNVVDALDSSRCLVLQAPPGAGKTTTVPLALLLHRPKYLKPSNRIVVLEPRRVAAKAAARRMAAILGEPVGKTVGYRVKLENKVSASTRIEVVTEGILLRRLQQDPELQGVGAVLLDEFHERSLDADTSLALLLDCQTWARPDLRLVVMSATLGGGLAQELAGLMKPQADLAGAAGTSHPGSSSSSSSNVPVIISEGRSFPVTTHFLGKPLLQKRGELERSAGEAVLKALQSSTAAGGDVLVFMPGVAEIRRLQQLLQQEPAVSNTGILVQQLHGGMSPQQQDDVIRPNRKGQQRRVIISTPIAESSITIDGVTAVVDSGLARAPCYDAATGISRLLTQRISQDSAEQRRGRAGRTQPGVCYRLWSSSDHEQLLPCSPPEISSADLAPLALQLASWGCPDGQALAWLDPPDPQELAEAQQLLLDLGAVDEKGSLTSTGSQMSAVPAHPRFAHMVLRAQALKAAELGCVLAALLSERDLFRGTGNNGNSDQLGADLAGRLRVLAGIDDAPWGYDAIAAKRVLLSAHQIMKQLDATAGDRSHSNSSSMDDCKAADTAASTLDELDEAENSMEFDDAEVGVPDDNLQVTVQATKGRDLTAQSNPSKDASFAAAWHAQLQKQGLVGALVAAAYPDRIAQAKTGSGGKPSFTLSSGRVVVLPSSSDALGNCQYIAVAELLAGRDGRNDRVVLGAALTPAAIQAYLQDDIREKAVVFWAASSKAVLAKQQRVLGSLVLAEQQVKVDDSQALPVLTKALADGGYGSLPISAAAESWRARAAWLYQTELAASGSSSIPDLTAPTLMDTLQHWLAPHLVGIRSRAQLQKLPWLDIFKSQMDWKHQQHVDQAAPSHLTLPTGSTAAINYTGAQPSAAVKMQEVFGLADTPMLGGNLAQVPLVLQLLSPAGRPLHVTSDLASFWAGAYTAVKKEMKGRYPKHYWPDDPAAAAPTKLTKRQMQQAADGAQGGNANDNNGAHKTAAGKAGMGLTNKKKR